MFVLEDMQGGVCSCGRCREVFVLEDMSKMEGGVCS